MKIVLTAICAFGIILSGVLTVNISIIRNRNIFGEWLAPIHVNIEIDKGNARDLSIFSEPHDAQYYYFSPTTQSEDQLKTIVLHTQLRTIGYHKRIYLRVPEQYAEQTIDAIDNISVFIGNKLYYFSKTQVKEFVESEQDGYLLFRFPNIYYERSLFTPEWVNYYGDLNLALNIICSFFLKPGDFVIPYLFIIGLLFLYRKNIQNVYERVRTDSSREKRVGAILLGLIIVLGFALRFNGFVRESGCSDEIYCGAIGGNPTLPFISTFADYGNPPFYFILLRYWFTLFGWSEASGTMLSVLLGTFAVPALYLLVKQNCGWKTALLAAFFMAISGFALIFSQLMRAYILKIFLAPVASLFFINYLRKASFKNLLCYILPSIALATAHHYGILFVIANFIFYISFSIYHKSVSLKKSLKKTAVFLTGNIIIALFCVPYFLYQMLASNYYFDRGEFHINSDHTLIFLAFAAASTAIFLCRKKIAAYLPLTDRKRVLFWYAFFMPLLIFALAYIVSFKKPMLHYRYWMPISYPFFITFLAILVSFSVSHKTMKYITVFLIWALSLSLYQSKALRLGADYEYYYEARAYIAADVDAHPGTKPAMLDNWQLAAAYYGFEVLPSYLDDPSVDVLYVFNGLFDMHEHTMYDELAAHNIDTSGLLKIIPNERIAIFKLPQVGALGTDSY
jgi:hypothetical protein